MTKESFEQIVLPPLALEALYGKPIYVIPEGSGSAGKKEMAMNAASAGETKSGDTEASTHLVTDPSPSWEIGLSGLFKRQVLVITQSDMQLSAEEKEFLNKILAAVKLKPTEDIAWLHLNQKERPTYSLLKEKFPAKVALYFGIEPAALGVPMRFPAYQVQPWDGCIFLYAPPLHELNGETDAHKAQKKNLWESLKKIFTPGN